MSDIILDDLPYIRLSWHNISFDNVSCASGEEVIGSTRVFILNRGCLILRKASVVDSLGLRYLLSTPDL